MGKVKKIVLFLAVLQCIIILSGCWDQKIFEETGFILSLGLELNEDGELIYSATMPVVEEEIEQDIEVLYTTAPLLREARDKIRNTSGKRVEGGKTQQILFSRELAEKGIDEILDVFLRSPENPVLANITVVDGSPLEMLQLSLGYKDKTRIGFYISNLIEQTRKRTSTPETRIYDLAVLLHCKTIDPIATYMKYDEQKVEILGTALFKEDKMVGDLNVTDTGILHALMGKKTNFSYYYREKSNDIKRGIAFLFRKLKRKVEIDTSASVPKINISLDFVATLEEYDSRHHLDDPKNKKELEKKVSEAMKSECMRILAYLQEVGSDPIGFGEMVRSKYNYYFKTIDWREVYPDIEFNVEVSTKIDFQGAIN